MLKQLKLKVWITIVLLSCSINSSANNLNINCDSVTGDVVISNDSVLIAYDDLRKVNSKLIELNYQKQINNNLKQIIANDSSIIKNYKDINLNINKNYNKAIRQRNIAIGGCIIITIFGSILLLVK